MAVVKNDGSLLERPMCLQSTSGFVKDNLPVFFGFFLGVYVYYLCLGMTFVYFCLLFCCFDVCVLCDVGLHIINCINGCLTNKAKFVYRIV